MFDPWKDKSDYWRSRKQEERCREMDRESKKNFARLDSGEIVHYTEMTRVGKKPTGIFDDYVFLGQGIFSHQERASAEFFPSVDDGFSDSDYAEFLAKALCQLKEEGGEEK